MRRKKKIIKRISILNNSKKAKISYSTIGACIGIIAIGLGVGFSVRTNEFRNDEIILTNNKNIVQPPIKNGELSLASGTIVVAPETYQNKSIKSLTIPNSVISVRAGAFLGNPELIVVKLSLELYLRLSGTGTSHIQRENFLNAIFGPQVGRYESLDDQSEAFTAHLSREIITNTPDTSGVLVIDTQSQLLSGSNYQGLDYKGQKLTEVQIRGEVKFILPTTFANDHNLLIVRLRRTLYDSLAGTGTPIEKLRRLEAIFGTQVKKYLSLDEKNEFTDHIETFPLKGSGNKGIEFNDEGKIKGNVFIYVSGQSNAQGEDTRDNVMGEYDIESTNIKILNVKENAFVALKKKNASSINLKISPLKDTAYSIAAKFADDVGKIVEGDVKVANFAVPGAGFRQNGKAFSLSPSSLKGQDSWSPSNLINIVTSENNAKKNEKKVSPIFFWHQGETDILAGTNASQYFDFMSTMISVYRDIVQDQNATFILGGYKDSISKIWPTAQIREIENANKRLAETIPNVGYASAKGLIGNANIQPVVHFGAESMEEFAARYFKEFRKNINDLTPSNFEIIQKGEYKLYSETRSRAYSDTLGDNWIKALRSGDDTTENFSKLADIWKYRNNDGYRFKYVAYNGDDTLTVTFKQNLNPMGILDSEREKLKDLLQFELLSVVDTSGQLNMDNISFDAMTIWDKDSYSTLNASKLGFFNGLGHNFALSSRDNKIVSSKNATSKTFNVADRIEFYALKD